MHPSLNFKSFHRQVKSINENQLTDILKQNSIDKFDNRFLNHKASNEQLQQIKEVEENKESLYGKQESNNHQESFEDFLEPFDMQDVSERLLNCQKDTRQFIRDPGVTRYKRIGINHDKDEIYMTSMQNIQHDIFRFDNSDEQKFRIDTENNPNHKNKNSKFTNMIDFNDKLGVNANNNQSQCEDLSQSQQYNFIIHRNEEEFNKKYQNPMNLSSALLA